MPRRVVGSVIITISPSNPFLNAGVHGLRALIYQSSEFTQTHVTRGGRLGIKRLIVCPYHIFKSINQTSIKP